DMTYSQWYEKYVEKRDLGLTEEEEYAINSWVSSDLYPINEKLRQGIELTNEGKKAITNLDHALG
ncbi:MAG: ADP-ribosyltransferase, partial [Acutalibacteraceae bacterium]